MDYAEIKKMTAVKLREVLHEKDPDIQGVTSMKKDQLVELLADKLGVQRHVMGKLKVDKTAVKAKIRELKKQRDEALGARDRKTLRDIQHQIHKQKHILRRAVKEAELAALRGR